MPNVWTLYHLPIILRSIGLKANGGVLPAAHFYLDARHIIDPSKEFAASGDDLKVQEYVMAHDSGAIAASLSSLRTAISCIPSRRRNRSAADIWKDPFEVLCVCAHGVHRSRALKHIMARKLKLAGFLNVSVK